MKEKKEKKKIKIGIIGCGEAARKKHFPSLRQNSGLNEIVAFCDIVPELAQRAAAEYGGPQARVYSDYNELLRDQEVDTVHICTPNVSHCPITTGAFRAGKHVFCESPMAISSMDALEMLDAWKQSGRQFTVGYQYRFYEEVLSLKAGIASGKLGRIYFAKAHAVKKKDIAGKNRLRSRTLQGGGSLIHMGAHALDMMLWLMGNYDVESVTGAVYDRMHLDSRENQLGLLAEEIPEMEDSAFGFIKMKNKASVYLEAAWALNLIESRETSATICGTLDGKEIYPGMRGLKEEISGSAGKDESAAAAEMRGWLEALVSGGEPLVKPEEAYIVSKVMEAVYRSAETGKTIYFN